MGGISLITVRCGGCGEEGQHPAGTPPIGSRRKGRTVCCLPPRAALTKGRCYVLKSVTHGGLPFPSLLAAACLRQKCARSCVSLFFPAADVLWLGGEFQNLAEAISPKHQSSSPACLPVLPTVFTGAHSALSTFFIVVFHLLPPGTAADKSGGPRLPAARHASSCSSQHTAARAGPHAPHSFACRLPSGEKCCLLPASSRS